MTEILAPLRAFVAALRMEGSVLRLDGKMAGVAAGAEAAKLADALTLCVYEHAYTKAYPPADAAPPGEERDLTQAIAGANTTRPRSETGWSVAESWADGSVVATRHGRTRRFGAGQFMPMNGVFPVVAGTALAVQLPAGSATRQPGFYYCFGEGFRDVHDQSPLVRLYWNLMAPGTEAFTAILTGALNRYEIPFELKVATHSAFSARRDNAVLYLARDVFPAAALALHAVLPALAGTLAPDVPLFTKALAPGVGFAEDPGGSNESFGSARSRLVATALAASRTDDGFSWDEFTRQFAEAVGAARLDMDALWLNPGSKDIYRFTQPSPRKAAA
ncbi:MAG TPA: T3SS effector HopA1 family protein [Allosphingosinicella sp.]|nr:T3SS effector HopA1 family protein [Allosphingosinicella sp.]